MKNVLGMFRRMLGSGGASALDAGKREVVRAREDLRKIYDRNWSDRGHL